jgi:hypothetical protein
MVKLLLLTECIVVRILSWLINLVSEALNPGHETLGLDTLSMFLTAGRQDGRRGILPRQVVTKAYCTRMLYQEKFYFILCAVGSSDTLSILMVLKMGEKYECVGDVRRLRQKRLIEYCSLPAKYA